MVFYFPESRCHASFYNQNFSKSLQIVTKQIFPPDFKALTKQKKGTLHSCVAGTGKYHRKDNRQFFVKTENKRHSSELKLPSSKGSRWRAAPIPKTQSIIIIGRVALGVCALSEDRRASAEQPLNSCARTTVNVYVTVIARVGQPPTKRNWIQKRYYGGEDVRAPPMHATWRSSVSCRLLRHGERERGNFEFLASFNL